MAIDYQSTIGQVRLLITDVSGTEADRLFTDEQINAFISMRGTVLRAAAQALRVVATSEVLIGKVIRTQAGTSTDGAKVSAELRALAREYETQADLEAAQAEDALFEIIPLCSSDYPEAAERVLP